MKRKILLFSPIPGVGSGGIAVWTKNILTYYDGLENSNVELFFLSANRSKIILASASKIRRFIEGLSDYLKIITRFAFEVKKINPDVVHISTSASIGTIKDLLLQIICKYFKAKNIIHFHFGRIPFLADKKNLEWKIILLLIKNADKVIVIDLKSYEVLVKYGYVNIELLANPLSDFVIKNIESNSNIERIPRTLLYVGHIVKTKGVFELVEACLGIENIKLKLIGPGSQLIINQLSEIANFKTEKEWFEITGNIPLNEVIKEMLSANVFVLPSYTEGFPNVILESMACGCPIVASEVGAIPEMLNMESDATGLCIAPQNIFELRKSILLFLNNSDYALNCGKKAKKRVVENYSMPVVWVELESIWEKA